MFSASRVNSKVDHYLDTFGPTSARAWLLLAWWCFRQALRPGRDAIVESRRPWRRRRAARPRLELGFSLNGGIGDQLIQSEYVRHFVARFADAPLRVTVFAMKSEPGNTAAALFHGARFIDETRPRPEGDRYRVIRRFDLFIRMDRFPQVLRADLPALQARSPALLAYCRRLLGFQAEHRFVVANSPRSDLLATTLCRLNGKTRYTGPDILGVLGMRDDGRKYMELDPADIAFVDRLGLLGRRYVTLQRGLDSNARSTTNVRLWPVERYAGLVRRLKERHPDVTIVQMGYSPAHCEPIAGVDLDLRGRTTLGQVKALLKHALLHVDYEGGYAHLMEFLHARALVLFGPTDRRFLGYERHLNIAADACAAPCEWASERWATSCLRGLERPACMDAISVDEVFAQASRHIAASRDVQATWRALDACPEDGPAGGRGALALVHLPPGSALRRLVQGRPADVLEAAPAATAGRAWCSGVYNVSAEDASYDTVFASVAGVTAYRGLVLRELLRILRPGGTALVETGCAAPQDPLSPRRDWPPAAQGAHVLVLVKAGPPVAPVIPIGRADAGPQAFTAPGA
jgi:hypothetical protein